MKIKVTPEDFLVDEILDVPIEKKGAFCLYLLEKKHENTVDVLHKLSDQLKIPFSDLSFGGRKDRHGLTRQHITIKTSNPPKEIQGNNYSLRFLGYLKRPMAPQLIKGNSFAIVVRSLSCPEAKNSIAEIAQIQKYGFANYFDDQRFGSFDPLQGFFAEKILKKHFNGALKVYLTHISSQDHKETKERKEFFYSSWGDWSACLKKARTPFENLAFSRLSIDPKGYIPLLQKIPQEELSLFFSAFQAFLWNEVLRRLIKTGIGENPLRSYPGSTGDYLFFTSQDPLQEGFFNKLTIPTPASNIKWHDQETKKAYTGLLEERGLKLSMFNITKIRQAFFKTTERSAVIVPENLRAEASSDSTHEGRQKLALSFWLPRGSYATMLIKRIFSN